MRLWLPRALALLALTAAFVAVIVAVNSVEATDEVGQQEARDAMAQLATANRTLSDQLAALAPGASPQQAQETVRSAAALSRRLDGEVTGEGNLAARVHGVLVAELAYLDAIGSTLNNPRSPLRERIMERGIALREVLQNVPGGDSGAVSGGAELVAYSKARVGEAP